jgi:hypothetical protein
MKSSRKGSSKCRRVVLCPWSFAAQGQFQVSGSKCREILPVPRSLFPIPESRPLPVPRCRFPNSGRWPPSAILAVPLSLVPRFRFPVPCSPFPVPRFRPYSALRTRNSCSRLGLQKQVSPGFRFSAPLLLIVYLSTAPKVIHNGVCPSVHVKNHQIRVKIDQKGDVFRQKAIKNERISSCPS